MGDGDNVRERTAPDSHPWYVYAVVAALVGGGSGFVVRGTDVTVSELSRDLGERDVRIEKLEATLGKFETRCLILTERIIRLEVELDDHGASPFQKPRTSDVDEKVQVASTEILCDFNRDGELTKDG